MSPNSQHSRAGEARIDAPPTRISILVAGFCVLALGCESSSRAICVGRLEGKHGPIKTGVVSLISLDDPDDSPPKGELDSDGHFEVFSDDPSGRILVGQYRIEYSGASGADAEFAGWPVTPAEVEVHKGQNYLDLELVPPLETQKKR